MSSLALNRINIALAFIGVFIAGFLSMTYMLKLSIPCGFTAGCDTVARHPSSKWFGVPVAYFGLATYLSILGLAIYRIVRPSPVSRLLLLAGFALSAIGTAVSIGLQIYSGMVIQDWCSWCIGSAATMALLFFFHALELQSVATVTQRKQSNTTDYLLIAIFGAALFASLGFGLNKLKGTSVIPVDFSVIPNINEVLVPKDAHTIGEPNSPLTVIEFADLNCRQCRDALPIVKEMVEKNVGKVRLVYRHFPLYLNHPNSIPAAVIAEYAAEHGKFWEYVDKAFELEPGPTNTVETYVAIANSLELDVSEVQKALKDTNSPAWSRTYRDLQLADNLGLSQTPTFIILAPDEEPIAVSFYGLKEMLNSPRYRRYLTSNVH